MTGCSSLMWGAGCARVTVAGGRGRSKFYMDSVSVIAMISIGSKGVDDPTQEERIFPRSNRVRMPRRRISHFNASGKGLIWADDWGEGTGRAGNIQLQVNRRE